MLLIGLEYWDSSIANIIKIGQQIDDNVKNKLKSKNKNK